MKKTVLYDRHIALGGKMVAFAGWMMPIQYSHGVVYEHKAVREGVGLFDISHMGRIDISGPQAEELLDYLSTNKISGKKDGSAVYTVWPREDGTAVDDLIVYRIDQTHFFVVANAGNREKDLAHLTEAAKGYDVVIKDHYEGYGILALQGPKAKVLLQQLFPVAKGIPFMSFCQVDFEGYPLVLSATGYTGSPGFELLAPNAVISALWPLLLVEGATFGIEPIGLGARDTLRLEMGFALYGHELSDTIAPTESVSHWTVRFQKERFVGKERLLALEENPAKRSQYGVVIDEGGIAREGYEVFSRGALTGVVTSGTFSPCLDKAIAIIMVSHPLQVNDQVEIRIRRNLVTARVVPLPFFHPTHENKSS